MKKEVRLDEPRWGQKHRISAKEHIWVLAEPEFFFLFFRNVSGISKFLNGGKPLQAVIDFGQLGFHILIFFFL